MQKHLEFLKTQIKQSSSAGQDFLTPQRPNGDGGLFKTISTPKPFFYNPSIMGSG
jgi:hypothetical protein